MHLPQRLPYDALVIPIGLWSSYKLSDSIRVNLTLATWHSRFFIIICWNKALIRTLFSSSRQFDPWLNKNHVYVLILNKIRHEIRFTVIPADVRLSRVYFSMKSYFGYLFLVFTLLKYHLLISFAEESLEKILGIIISNNNDNRRWLRKIYRDEYLQVISL